MRTLVRSLPVLFPMLVVWAGDYALSIVQAKPFYFHEEFGPRTANTVIAAIPFIVLLLYTEAKFRSSDKAVRSGIKAATFALLGTSLMLWSLLYIDAVLRTGGGANIGLGILLLLSPVYLPFLIPLGFRLGVRWELQRHRTI
jgi:hypothetical protein